MVLNCGKSLCFLTFLLIWQQLVPCVLLSFDVEQILMWRGRDWKSMYGEAPSTLHPAKADISSGIDDSGMHYKLLMFGPINCLTIYFYTL